MTSAFPIDDPIAAMLGVKVLELSGDGAKITWEVSPKVHQPAGVLHGGIHSWINESLASLAGARWFAERGRVVGVNNNCDFFRAVDHGELTTIAQPVHRGRSQQLWTLETRDQQERLIALGQVRLHNLWADPATVRP
jgi:1,4-dihydroxy-2-naphthoyl-CoA hydrolase